jgi:anti-repressor protein
MHGNWCMKQYRPNCKRLKQFRTRQKEFITISKETGGTVEVQTVDACELHKILGIKTLFRNWIARRIEEYEFVVNTDFCSFLSESYGGRPSHECHLPIDMAKELSMVERNEKGQQARQYFLDCERWLKAPGSLTEMEVQNRLS